MGYGYGWIHLHFYLQDHFALMDRTETVSLSGTDGPPLDSLSDPSSMFPGYQTKHSNIL